MKKKKMKLIVLFVCVIVLNVGCTFNNKKEYISNIIEISLDNCTIENENDSHDGFLGDGDYFAKIICGEQEINQIKSKWKKLPLKDEIQHVMNMKQCNNEGCKDVYEKYNISNIINGYYYFYDRHKEATNNKDEKWLNKRSSYNFSVGIYDSDNYVLYYYELDT